MIIRPKDNWFRMLLVWRGSVLPQLLPRLILLFLFSVLVVYFRTTLFTYKIQLNPAPFTLFGIALALFLGFRNNVSYDRFWEARKLWGALIIDTRSLARQALTLTRYADGATAPSLFIDQLIAFSYSLKHQLRRTSAQEDLHRLLPGEQATRLGTATFKPVMLLKDMGQWVKEAKEQSKIDTIQQKAFDENLNKLSEIVGGCERIANTPIPYTYNVMLHRTIYLYCFLLPLGFADSLAWMMPIVVTFIAYTFVALEALADQLEDPFGLDPNDLALDAMCRTIENTLLELDGRELLPEMEPVDFFIT